MRVAAIGYGAFGAFVLSALKELPEVTLYAVAGRRAEKVQSFAEQMDIPHWTTDWRTLVSDPQVDIVCVLTPPSTHDEIAIAAAQNGKHLFIEKPLALTPEEADAVIAAVQASGVRAVVNHIMRYHPLYAWLKERIASGKLGGVRKVWFVNFASCEGLAPEHWFWDERQSGGVLVEHGVHFFHLFAWLLDEVPEPVATFGHAPFEAWSIVRFARHDAFGSFYHCFDRAGALERNFGGIALEHGFATDEDVFQRQHRVDRDLRVGEHVFGEIKGGDGRFAVGGVPKHFIVAHLRIAGCPEIILVVTGQLGKNRGVVDEPSIHGSRQCFSDFCCRQDLLVLLSLRHHHPVTSARQERHCPCSQSERNATQQQITTPHRTCPFP